MTNRPSFARRSLCVGALFASLALGACGPTNTTPDTSTSDATPSNDAPPGSGEAGTGGGGEAGTGPDGGLGDAGLDAGSNPDATGTPEGGAGDARGDVVNDGPPLCLGAGMGGADPARTFTYAFNAMVIDRTSSASEAHTGFNLDGMTSTAADEGGCRRQDFFSLYDNDQHGPSGCARGTEGCAGGVDNQLPGLIDEFSTRFSDVLMGQDIRTGVNTQVGYARFSIVVRVSEVDDLVNDPSVTVRVYRAFASYTPGPFSCRASEPDQEYQISTVSLRPGATSIDDALMTMTGSIVNGRLRAQASAGSVFSIPVPGLSVGDLNFNIRDMQLRFNMSALNGTDGNLGGRVQGNELMDELKRLLPLFTTTFQTVFDGLIDIRDGSTCVDTTRPVTSGRPSQRYGSLGLGLGFSLVRARLDARCPITDRAAPGTCSVRE